MPALKISEKRFNTYSALIESLTLDAKQISELNPWSNELPALISHWIFKGATKPPISSKQFKLGWRKLIALQKSSNVSEGTEREIQLSFEFDQIAADIPFLQAGSTDFKFIDLFAGIGGFRIALQNNGGECVFSSEWDKAAKKTYFRNFGEIPYGDIRQFTGDGISDKQIDELIPDHDVLAAGFPCQPFSRAGVSARESLGQSHGFSCDVQGTLFFDIVRIAKVKRPKILFLENVRNLMSHDGGNTFRIIRETIENDLGYSFNFALINSAPLVPQKRIRCYMVCTREHDDQFSFPTIEGEPRKLKEILEKGKRVDEYTISDRLWQGHINRTARNIKRGTGFTANEADINKPANTLVSRYGKDGKECLIPQKGKNPRMLTPRECARLQGYPDNYITALSKAAAYRQFGNSVAVPVIQKIAENIKKVLVDS